LRNFLFQKLAKCEERKAPHFSAGIAPSSKFLLLLSMIKLYRKESVEFKGYHEGKRVIALNPVPTEFKERTIVDLLIENSNTPYSRYSVQRIKFDETAGIFYPESFAVNYGGNRVDSAPLVRGFIPEGHNSQRQTLYEIMPMKREIHIIPHPL
jgi:hypothetical protein